MRVFNDDGLIALLDEGAISEMDVRAHALGTASAELKRLVRQRSAEVMRGRQRCANFSADRAAFVERSTVARAENRMRRR